MNDFTWNVSLNCLPACFLWVIISQHIKYMWVVFTWSHFPISGGLFYFVPFLCNQDIPCTRRPPNPLQDLLWVRSLNKILQSLVPQFISTEVFKQSLECCCSPFFLSILFLFSTHHLPSGIFRLAELSAWVWLDLICCAAIESFTRLRCVNCFYCFFSFTFTVSKKKKTSADTVSSCRAFVFYREVLDVFSLSPESHLLTGIPGC